MSLRARLARPTFDPSKNCFTSSAGPDVSQIDEINWREELRKIEREYDGLPPARSRTQIRLQKIQELVAQERFNERLAAFGIWARLGLVAALGTSMYWWPYDHSCGYGLAGFLAAQAMVVVGGVIVGVMTWRQRMPLRFGLASLFIIAAWTGIALYTLPRLGIDAAGMGTGPSGWSCAASHVSIR